MSKPTDPQVVWHHSTVTLKDRESRQGHRAGVVWFTGLSGSGKSTIANLVDQMLFRRGIRTLLLDGDNVRHGLCATPAILSPEHGEAFAERFGLGFSALDREENIRRVGAAAGLLVSSGLIVLTAFVSPYRRDRDRVRQSLKKQLSQTDPFLEVFVDTPLEICEARDPKGLYQQARAGKIANFTGISDPYEAPLEPELVLAGGKADPTTLASLTVTMLEDRGWIPKPRLHATILVAAAENGTIGRDNQLPWRLRSDLQRFKQLTMGHALIMGRKTFESIGRVLPGRKSIVLSRTGMFSHPGVEVFSDIREAIQSLPKDVHPFIVGGSEIYRQTLDLVDRIMLTRILADIPGDATLEPWDRSGWELTQQLHVPEGPHDEYPTIFETWERSKRG